MTGPDLQGLQGIGMTSRRARQRLVQRLRNQGIADEGVLEVLLETPRHLFIDEALASRAYEDTALPIGFGQTISQPYIVARMTEILRAGGTLHKVLEIGTGSGYQAAVLAALAERVYSVERISRLLDQARQRIRILGYSNVRLKYDDGAIGWTRYAPYDGIMITAAAEQVPDELLEQLSIGGRLLAPVGNGTEQELLLVQRRAFGFERSRLEAVSFVPLLGGIL